jgi:hypothetical protein
MVDACDMLAARQQPCYVGSAATADVKRRSFAFNWKIFERPLGQDCVMAGIHALYHISAEQAGWLAGIAVKSALEAHSYLLSDLWTKI